MVYPVREAAGVSAGEPLPRDFYLFAGEAESPTSRGAVTASAVIPIFSFLAWNPAATAMIPWQPENENAVAATGTVTFQSTPDPGDYLYVDGVMGAFVSSSPIAGKQILIGADETATAAAVAAFFAPLSGHTTPSASGNVVTFTAKTAGAAGNTIMMLSSGFLIELSGATLEGGVDAVTATGDAVALLACESPVGTQSLPYYEAGYFNQDAINWPASLKTATLVERQYALRNAERFTIGSLS